ncbi:16S rRNA (cytidine(1402)-2'-O)-methyltransferase [Corynebacterium caspium]|uniref:16S rRNA (cytidine(1402)-2'-O)-methyltransferase n=1 Tax=Corynebacterium caspium TaxID=234828 RepID=UPI000364FF29|nr:16S rRNA (cytidine(1402)-2'-O)-methyltransferase [Corynebacterium caspium]WKD59607.1 Ribosomal RNA small subunit methyltransferase I [Corynebacterium caspium DSM 44850]
MSEQPRLPHGVIIAATPLGNPEDASPRLRAGLAYADIIAAEDTRRAKSLAAALGVKIQGTLISHFDHNEKARLEQLLAAARHSTVLVISDAGMPVVSDPGLVLVDAALDAGIPVTCFPGPSAVPTALALSGLGVGKFIFEGFAPRKGRKNWLAGFAREERAVCFFESPHRLADTLQAALEVLGPQRRVAVCRELSKTYEEVRRGTLAELAPWAVEVRGEITVVLDGVHETQDVANLISAVEERVAAGERLKNVCREIAAATGTSAKELYNAVLAARSQ